MDKHVQEIFGYIPNLFGIKVLDLGAGKGRFMFEIIKNGGNVTGVEPYEEYIKLLKQRAEEIGVDVSIIQGVGEKLTFSDNEFGFVNMSEVIEHVIDPRLVMSEVHRVLVPGGSVYISVPNRFGIKDQHFNLYFINWLPRKWGAAVISMLNIKRDYERNNGVQRLNEMHYFTYKKIKSLLMSLGFDVIDIRETKIKKLFPNPIIRFFIQTVYTVVKNFYFDSFHFLLKKPTIK